MDIRSPASGPELTRAHMIYLNGSVLQRILDRCRTHHGREVCGLLIGQSHAEDIYIERLIWSPNQARTPEAEFMIAPQLQFRLARLLRRTPLDVVGVYHSHPTDVAYPSGTDREKGAGDGLLWMISRGDGQQVRLFSLEKDREVVEYSYQVRV